MTPAILGKKVGMTQVFEASGNRVPVTVVQAGPCIVLQVKKSDGKDGYDAVQLGFDEVKPHRSTLAQIGHARTAKTGPKRYIREIRLDSPTDKNVGDSVTVEMFTASKVAFVDVRGVTKGKGFQGVMKRHGFGGQSSSHGTERKHRSPGSIGAHAQNRGTSGAVKKGKRMGGHMGMTSCTVQSHALVGVDADNNLLLIKGSVPGPTGGYVLVQQAVKRKSKA